MENLHQVLVWSSPADQLLLLEKLMLVLTDRCQKTQRITVQGCRPVRPVLTPGH